MSRKLLLVAVVLGLVLGLGVSYAVQSDLFGANAVKPVLDNGYPADDGVVETIVDEMPVPGAGDVVEREVVSEMPVPGYEGVDEMIVNGQ